MNPYETIANPLQLDPEARRRLAQSGAPIPGRRDPFDLSRGIFRVFDALSDELRRIRT